MEIDITRNNLRMTWAKPDIEFHANDVQDIGKSNDEFYWFEDSEGEEHRFDYPTGMLLTGNISIQIPEDKRQKLKNFLDRHK